MKILQRAKQLPEDEAVVHVLEEVCSHYAVEIGLEALEQNVEITIIRRSMHFD
jgi:hypothetical protein